MDSMEQKSQDFCPKSCPRIYPLCSDILQILHKRMKSVLKVHGNEICVLYKSSSVLPYSTGRSKKTTLQDFFLRYLSEVNSDLDLLKLS
jgi:hypothetical protein